MNLRNKLEQKLVGNLESARMRECLLPHADLIFRCACRLSRKTQDAEDLTQETYYYAIKNFAQLKDRNKAKNWLFSILRNLFLKEIERNRKKVDLEFEAFSNQLSSEVDLEAELLRVETCRTLREVLDKLDERLRMPIEMFYFERLTYKEIALVLNVPIGTVMSRIARGKVYVKRELSRLELFKNI